MNLNSRGVRGGKEVWRASQFAGGSECLKSFGDNLFLLGGSLSCYPQFIFTIYVSYCALRLNRDGTDACCVYIISLSLFGNHKF